MTNRLGGRWPGYRDHEPQGPVKRVLSTVTRTSSESAFCVTCFRLVYPQTNGNGLVHDYDRDGRRHRCP